MDNQKSSEAKGSNLSGNLGSGSGNLGKDQSMGSTGSSTGGATASSTGAVGGTSNAGNLQSAGAGAATGSGAGGEAKDINAQVANKAQDLHQSIDKAADAAKPYVDRAINSVQPVVDRLASSAHAGVDKLQGYLSSASQSLGQGQQKLNDVYGQSLEQGREYVRQNPATAVAIAAAAGFILAKLMGGSRREY